MLSTIAVLLTEPVAMFELGVVCEVFGIDRTDDGVPPFDFRMCSVTPGTPLAVSSGGFVIADRPIEAALDADIVIIPTGGPDEQPPTEVLQALRDSVDRGTRVMSVCSGAFVLGAAGLLDDRDCTTHWLLAGELARRYPQARVNPDVLFMSDGPVLTSAGTAAGIDACLHLVRAELGTAVAARIARRMVVPPQRDGGQRQFVEAPLPPGQADSLVPVLTWMMEHLEVDHTIPDLAKQAQMSERTFARRFVAEVGTTPHRWLTTQRVLHARTLLEATDLSIEQIAHASGFTSAALLRHHFRHVVGLAPGDYRKRFTHVDQAQAAGQVSYHASE